LDFQNLTFIFVFYTYRTKYAMTETNNQYNPSLSVDCVIFGFDSKQLKILLVERSGPYQTNPQLKLPGSLVLKNTKLEVYANQVLKELTGLNEIYLKQFYTFGNPDRIKTPEDIEWIENTYQVTIERVVSISYYSLVKIDQYNLNLSEESYHAKWYNISDIHELAFDHMEIMKKGLEALRQELIYNPLICFELLPEKFSLRELQDTYESIQGIEYDNRNFRKKIGKAKYIIQLNEKQLGVAHKPALLYKFDKEQYQTNRLELIKFFI